MIGEPKRPQALTQFQGRGQLDTRLAEMDSIKLSYALNRRFRQFCCLVSGHVEKHKNFECLSEPRELWCVCAKCGSQRLFFKVAQHN